MFKNTEQSLDIKFHENSHFIQFRFSFKPKMIFKIFFLTLALVALSLGDSNLLVLKTKYVDPLVEELKKDVDANNQIEAIKSYLEVDKSSLQDLVNGVTIDNEAKRLLTSDALKEAVNEIISLMNVVLPKFEESEEELKEGLKEYFTNKKNLIVDFATKEIPLENSEYEAENEAMKKLFGNQLNTFSPVSENIDNEGVEAAIKKYVANSANDYFSFEEDINAGKKNQPM